MHEVAGVIMFALALLCVAKLVIDKKYKSRRAAEAPSTTGTPSCSFRSRARASGVAPS